MPPIKLKIELENMPHKVIRKVLLPENINMHQLHLVIQVAMGWMNSHLFEFSDKKWAGQYRAGIPNEMDDYFSESPQDVLKDAHQVSLKKTFFQQNDGKPFWYTYDFGDGWMHKVSFQKVSQNQLNDFEGLPLCIEAKGKCPPEDIGGPWGYVDFLDIIHDKNHPEREETMEWYGIDSEEEYDELNVDLVSINRSLVDIYESKNWKSKKYDKF